MYNIYYSTYTMYNIYNSTYTMYNIYYSRYTMYMHIEYTQMLCPLTCA